jgi:hypothetical protein
LDGLNKLLDNHTVAAIGAPILIIVLAAALIQSWRAVRRGDPIPSSFLRQPVYPDNPWYMIYLARLWGVTAAAFLVIAPIALLVLVALILQALHN